MVVCEVVSQLLLTLFKVFSDVFNDFMNNQAAGISVYHDCNNRFKYLDKDRNS